MKIDGGDTCYDGFIVRFCSTQSVPLVSNLISIILFETLDSMVPTRTGKQGKPGKMVRHFPVKQKSGNFTQNTGKIRKNYTGKLNKILKSQGNLSASNSENCANMVPYF